MYSEKVQPEMFQVDRALFVFEDLLYAFEQLEEIIMSSSFSAYGEDYTAFLKATKIREFEVATLSDTLWEMEFLEKLLILKRKSHTVIPAEIAKLTKLTGLEVCANRVTLKGTIPVRYFLLRDCEKLKVDKTLT